MSNIVGTTIVELFTRGQQVRCISQLYDLAARSGFILDKRDTPGFKFETAIFKSQDKYKDAKFVILDGNPHSGDFNPVVKDNTVAVFFAEHESGFLAGVAAALELKEGEAGFIGGMEMGNAFTELNDPLEQRRRFEELQELYSGGEEELNPIDEDYLSAMAYGMPPNGGFGTGVDRLAMLLMDKHSIREVLLYPHLREKEEG